MTATPPTIESQNAGQAPPRSGEDAEEREKPQSALLLNLVRLLGLGALIAVWEFFSSAYDAEFWVSRPSAIWSQLWEWVTSGYLTFHLGITLQEMVLGFLFGAGAGIIVGFILGLTPYLGKLLDPFIMAVYSLPKIALAPLFVLWFGIGISMKVILTATIVFFLVFWNTYAGVRERNSELIDVLRVMGAKRRHIIAKVVLPGAMTYIYVGLKIAIPYALIGAVVGEIIASNRGIGFVLMAAAGAFNTSGVFAALIVLMIISTILNATLNRSERYVLRWKRAG